MDYEIVDDSDSENELYEPEVNIILLKTKLFAVLCCEYQ
jgi:hypothetical protein